MLLKLFLVLNLLGLVSIPNPAFSSEVPGAIFADGPGPVEVIIFSDYFCPPCQALEPYLEEALPRLRQSGARIAFVDMPIHGLTPLFARYFLYAANAADGFGDIRQYLVQDKKQQAVAAYVDSLGDTADLRINETWAASQYRLALDNPVDRARRSGKPTMVEFGSEGCVPCDMMQPILDKLRKAYPDRLNVVFVKVREEQVLAARYGIRSIPVQVFYDANGQEVFRHVGFYAEKEVLKQLKKAGLQL